MSLRSCDIFIKRPLFPVNSTERFTPGSQAIQFPAGRFECRQKWFARIFHFSLMELLNRRRFAAIGGGAKQIARQKESQIPVRSNLFR